MMNVDSFYNVVFIFWRGRFYTSNCQLNIQGWELAISLMLFKNGNVLTSRPRTRSLGLGRRGDENLIKSLVDYLGIALALACAAAGKK